MDSTGGMEVEAAYLKSAWRVVPFLALMFFSAWLDRYNLGFAKLRMVKDLGFSEAVYGFGAGIVYLGYLLFEVPSNLLLLRIGARKTFVRITILWGLISIAMLMVKTAAWFYALRFLLGAAEAGLYPGVVLYLTFWFPRRRRSQMQALFNVSVPVTSIVGGPVSGWIMEAMDGRGGLANWQWLFLLEGIPSVVIGLLAIAIVVDGPQKASWLSEREKQLVIADLAADQDGARTHGFGEALRSRQLWLLALTYFCLTSASVTLPFWIPTIIQGLGVHSTLQIGLLSTLPYFATLVAMLLVSRSSDRRLERRWHAAFSCLVCAAGLSGVGLLAHVPVLAFIALMLATAGPTCAVVVFWPIPPALLGGVAAAGGIALINAIGNLSGWLGPAVVGALKDFTGTAATGLYLVAGLEVVAAILLLRFVPAPAKARVTASS